MTIGQGVELGPVSLPVYRIVLAVGLLRVILRRETVAGGINTIDKLMIAWAGWMVFASFFHAWMPGSGPVYASGFVFNVTLGLFPDQGVVQRSVRTDGRVENGGVAARAGRAWRCSRSTSTRETIFGMFGGVPEDVYVRDGADSGTRPIRASDSGRYGRRRVLSADDRHLASAPHQRDHRPGCLRCHRVRQSPRAVR